MGNIQLKLRDIAGFDSLSNWPPAPIWWILAAIILLVIIIIARKTYKKVLYKRSWEYDAASQLSELEAHLNANNAHQSLVQLSELIKRIIIEKYGRENCASLTGSKLLKWLEENDPNDFKWQTQGKMILDKTYAPSDSNIDPKQIRVLIAAISRWVDRCGIKKKKCEDRGKVNV